MAIQYNTFSTSNRFTSSSPFLLLSVNPKLTENDKVKEQSANGSKQPRGVDDEILPAGIFEQNGSHSSEVAETGKQEEHEGDTLARLSLVVEHNLRHPRAQVEGST